MNNYAIVGFFLLLVIVPSSFGKIIPTIPQDVHWRVEYSLITFAAFYDEFCLRQHEQSGLKEFEVVASAVEELGHDKRLNITFLKVNRKGDPDALRNLGVMYPFCSGNPTFTLYRYGSKKDYGYQGSVEKMLDWLQKNAEPPLTIITTRPDLASFIAASKYSVVGYFKDPKLWQYFYTAADSDDLQGIDFADVQNSDLSSAYSKDTVVVYQKFGRIQVALNENLTVERITTFVKVNTHFTKPIIMHDWSPSELKDAIQNTSIIFVQFYTNQCPVASFVKDAAQVGHDNGMLDYLDMKFVSVNMTKYHENLATYGLTPSTCRDKSLWSAPLVMRLFRYGRMVKYVNVLISRETFSLEGLLQWLEKNTKPATRMVEEPEDLNLIVNYHETSIIGYFKDGSHKRNIFRRVAELFPKYTFGETISPEVNPFSEDLVILYELYGESFKNLTGNFTRDMLNTFVSSNVNQDLPVNTRPTPTPVPDVVYRSAKQIAIFDKIKFKGNSLIIQLSDNCTDIPETWGQGTWSIKTFGECVDFFEDVGCRSSSKNFRLDMTESVHPDITPVKPPSGFRSMDFCSKWKDTTNSASFMQYSIRQPYVVCYVLLRLMLYV